MALSDKDILKHKELGNIVIEPFNRINLATSSYDVRLGEWYFREQRQNFDVYNPYNKNQTDKVWGTKPRQADLAKHILKDFDFKGIAPTDKVILISPGETILAHTEEFLGGRNEVTTMMKARSSMGRNFIEVCKCAGWGDVGYTNRWTMEITNNSRFYTIPLVVGRRIAQIVFFHVGPVLEKDYTNAGKYQKTTDIKKIKKEWSPLSMLPKLYKDPEIKK
ncbi:MAG: dCTP deaminase [bacterium]|nr:dCTP deaminase [bacterium]